MHLSQNSERQSRHVDAHGTPMLPSSAIENIIQRQVARGPTIVQQENPMPNLMSLVVDVEPHQTQQHANQSVYDGGSIVLRNTLQVKQLLVRPDGSALLQPDKNMNLESCLLPFMFPYGTGSFLASTRSFTFPDYLRYRMKSLLSPGTLIKPYLLLMYQVRQAVYFEDYVVVSDDLKAPKDSTLIGSDILGNKLNQKYKSGPRTQHSMEYRKQTLEHEYSSILHLQLNMVLHARTIWETKDTSQNCTCNPVPRRHLLKPSAYASSKTYFEDYVVVTDDLKAPKDSTLIGSDILGNKRMRNMPAIHPARQTLLHADVIVIDEMSMLTAFLLSLIAFRLKQVTPPSTVGGRQAAEVCPFAEKHIILVGDLAQLNQKYKSGPRTQHSMEYRKQTLEHEYSSILHLQLNMVLHARTIWETKDTSQNCTCNPVPRRHLLKPSAYASSKT
eukprot:gene6763-2640_t